MGLDFSHLFYWRWCLPSISRNFSGIFIHRSLFHGLTLNPYSLPLIPYLPTHFPNPNNLTPTHIFRLIATVMPDVGSAGSMCGVFVILMVLFSGFIQPFSEISYGWVWFYYINPIAWVLQAVTINEFLSAKYDFQVCTNAACTITQSFGINYLESRGMYMYMDICKYVYVYIYIHF
jgi:hypothetical protein